MRGRSRRDLETRSAVTILAVDNIFSFELPTVVDQLQKGITMLNNLLDTQGLSSGRYTWVY